MGLIDRNGAPAAAPDSRILPRPPRRFISEFEAEIRQLYVRMIDEPIPTRMIEVLRAGMAGPKP